MEVRTMVRRGKSGRLFILGMVLGLAGGAGAVSLLCYWHKGRPPWGLHVPDHPNHIPLRDVDTWICTMRGVNAADIINIAGEILVKIS